MAWYLNHHFVGLPCERGVRLTFPRQRSRRRRPCPRPTGMGIAESVRDGVSALLTRRGIDYAPVGQDGEWLWCLGGPDLYRLPLPTGYESYADADSCIDLNLWVCEEHQVIATELFPYDLVPESGGSGPADPLQSTPIAIGVGRAPAAADFLLRLEVWLDSILVLPPQR